MRESMIVRLLIVGSLLVAGLVSSRAAELVPDGAQWRYLKGFSEASNPVYNWRGVAFNDSSWTLGVTPFFYGETLNGTDLPDMRGAYSSVFMRKVFNVANPFAEGNLELTTRSDDGFIAWINGIEVFRYNMPDGDVPVSGSSLPALSEPIPY